MTGLVEDQLIADLAREQVARLAPQELPLYPATSEAYFNSSRTTVEKQTSHDEMLGFGVEESVAFLTPIILVVTNEVVEFVVTEVRRAVQTESSALISKFVKNMFKKFRSVESETESKMPSLTQEQLAQIHSLAFEKARQLRLSEDRAELLADSLAGSLVTDTA